VSTVVRKNRVAGWREENGSANRGVSHTICSQNNDRANHSTRCAIFTPHTLGLGHQCTKGVHNVVVGGLGVFTVIHENRNVLVLKAVHIFNVLNLKGKTFPTRSRELLLTRRREEKKHRESNLPC
jgi:hypothetical protein